MITSIEIPHLAKGQSIAQFKKVFSAATATLKPEQQLACLPVYIHRTEGEKQLAFTASEEETLQAAFKFLEDLIDGPPCKQGRIQSNVVGGVPELLGGCELDGAKRRRASATEAA